MCLVAEYTPLARNVFVGAARRGFGLSPAETTGKIILED